MKYSIVVFDLAGTTVRDNKDVHRVLKDTLYQWGVEISIKEANDVMGIPKPVAIKKLLKLHRFGETGDQVIREMHEVFVERMKEFYRLDPSVGEKAGVTETFLALRKKGIKVAIDTGFDREITNTLLQRLGWERNDLINTSVTSDEVLRGRPFPDMITESMRRLGVTNPAGVIKVGDTVSDIQQGYAAKCGLVVAVTTGAFSYDELLEENPDFLIDQIPEILDFIR
jgi:phosphonatase-like hydrolase